VHYRFLVGTVALAACAASFVASQTGKARAAQPAKSVAFYVALDGNDAWSGRAAAPNRKGSDGPFATLQHARDVVRALKAQGLAVPVEVVIRGGTYDQSEPLVLTPQDGGSAACPITWRAREGERVLLRGSRKITGWKLWHDGIYQADLKTQGLKDVPFHDLYYRKAGTPRSGFAERQILARYPNFDPQHPLHGGFLYMPQRPVIQAEKFVYDQGDIPWDKWKDLSQAEVFTVYGHGWHFAMSPIRNVDQKARTITMQRVSRPLYRLNRYFIQNVLDALDAPGEWYLDRKASILYFYPPDGGIKGEVIAPVIDNIVEVRGTIPFPYDYLNMAYRGPLDKTPMPADAPPMNPVENLVFAGLDFEGARQDALRITGARNCQVLRCRIANVGNTGVNLGGAVSAFSEEGAPRVVPATGHLGGAGSGGETVLLNDPGLNCRVAGCDIWSTGTEGIMLFGRDNVAENNHVYDIGVYSRECAGINLMGERNIVRRNTVHDTPHCGIFFKGVDNIIELNDVHHTVMDSQDMGAIRSVQRNPYLKGNIIRFNKIFDTVGYGFRYQEGTHYESPFDVWGIYLDDITCGTTVYGNIIARAGQGGVEIHGGGDNKVDNNIIVNAGQYLFEYLPMPDGINFGGVEHVFAGNHSSHNILVATEPGVAPYRVHVRADNLTATEVGVAPGQGNRGPNNRQRNNRAQNDGGPGNLPAEDYPTMDHNLVWFGDKAPFVMHQQFVGVKGWDAWLQMGHDKGSVLGDPLFVNAKADDYRLRPDSPALKMGFAPIPVDQIGCFKSAERASWPISPNRDRFREKPILHVAAGYNGIDTVPRPRLIGPSRDDFESTQAGKPPREGVVTVSKPAEIVVSDKIAAGGKRSLRFASAPGVAEQPAIYYEVNYAAGVAVFSADFRIDGHEPASFSIDPRQHATTRLGALMKDFVSGPQLTVDANGDLRSGKEVLTPLPLDQWFTIRLRMELGAKAPKQSDLTVTVRGGAPQHFKAAYLSSEFTHLDRVAIADLAPAKSVFYMDNLSIALEGEK
jgi:hypothetical protein